jgi:Paf1
LYLDEKDKFLLSDKNTFELEEAQPTIKVPEKKIPVRYQMIDKVNKWGTDIRNPIAVRSLEEEADRNTVYTLQKDKAKRHLAIELI